MSELTAEQTKIINEVKAKYGDNHWWDGDIETIAYHQLNEDILIVNFTKFHEGVEKLLGHPVWTHEFAFNMDGLKAEAGVAYKKHLERETL